MELYNHFLLNPMSSPCTGGAQLLDMGTLIPRRSFALPAGAFSLNLLPIITLCRVYIHVTPRRVQTVEQTSHLWMLHRLTAPSCLMSPKSFDGKGEGILAGDPSLVGLIWQWLG